MSFTLHPRGPFSLEQAARVLASFPVPTSTWDGTTLRIAFALEGNWEAVGAALTQDGSAVHVDAPAEARPALERIFSLDQDATAFERILANDPVLRRIASRHPGLRPVLFGSPWEAAVWSILTQRVQMAQAATKMRRLAEEHGAAVQVAGETLHAFPGPEEFLRIRGIPGVVAQKIDWLHDDAHAALRGQLDAARLRALPTDEAVKALRQLPGIGAFSAELVLIRGAGAPDLLPLAAARAQHAAERAYGPGASLAQVGERWRPMRSWGAFLLRFAGEEPPQL